MLIRPQATQDSLKVTSTRSSLKAELSFFDLRICQRTVTAVSNLAKDVYSCKNVIKRGKKRRFFRAFLKKSRSNAEQAEAHQADAADSQNNSGSSFEVTAEVRKIRVLVYDSAESETKLMTSDAIKKSKDAHTPAGPFVKNLRA